MTKFVLIVVLLITPTLAFISEAITPSETTDIAKTDEHIVALTPTVHLQ